MKKLSPHVDMHLVLRLPKALVNRLAGDAQRRGSTMHRHLQELLEAQAALLPPDKAPIFASRDGKAQFWRGITLTPVHRFTRHTPTSAAKHPPGAATRLFRSRRAHPAVDR